MGKWTEYEPEPGIICGIEPCMKVAATNRYTAEILCHAHNADLAALEAERDELRGRLGNIVESLKTLRGEPPCECAPRYSYCRCKAKTDAYQLVYYEAIDDALDIAEGRG